MPAPFLIGGIIARAALKKIATSQRAIRTVGGITGGGSKSVTPVYKNMTDNIQSNSVKVTKTQAQINAEGLAKIRQTLNIPAKGTPAAAKTSAQIKKDAAVSSQKAGKASTTISKKTYNN